MIGTAAADGDVSFKVDAPTITPLGSYLRVAFEVDARPDDDSFEAPDFAGFDILAGPTVATGRQTYWINGKQTVTESYTYTYVLMPQAKGTYTIGAARISVDGRSYTTKPLPVEVIDEGDQSESRSNRNNSSPEAHVAKDDIQLRIKLSSTSVYKGEAVRASIVLYTRTSIATINNVKLPTFEGFWSQELPAGEDSSSREELDGKVYTTYLLKEYLLYPQQSGALRIDPAELTAVAQVVTQSSRGFDPFFGGQEVHNVNRKVSTPAITLNVKPLPEGAPRSFNGAVGQFTMQGSMPPSKISVNSAASISLTISGRGNLKFIDAPSVAMPESFEIYDTKTSDSIKVSAVGTSGTIKYEYPFVARSSGEFRIAPVEFSFFDPAKEQYVTLSTEPITLTVTNDGSAAGITADSRTLTSYGEKMKQLDRDIRFIHTESGKLRREHRLFMFSPTYFLLVVIIIAAFVVIYAVMRQRIRENRNIVQRRIKHANKVAVQRLRMAERYMKQQQRHPFYEEMLKAMWGYISDKFNIPVANLTKETIREELYRRGVAAADAELFCEIISRCDEAQYAPSTSNSMEEVYADAMEIISKIESIVKR
ncbi:MAG: BatD family protein [Alistipes sp.]|nr:BatD family protein [Alistipes sp.]